jgi:hypothetical protein
MDIQLASTYSQACSGRKLILNLSRLMNSVKSYLEKIRYFNWLIRVGRVCQIYKPSTLIIIMRSQISLTDC